jgi:hypothetical protein
MRSLEFCVRQCSPVRHGKIDLVEVNWLAALAGTSWQEALQFVKRRFLR